MPHLSLAILLYAIIPCKLSRFVAGSCQSLSCDHVKAIAVQRSAEVGFASVAYSLPSPLNFATVHGWPQSHMTSCCVCADIRLCSVFVNSFGVVHDSGI